jgi:hypothetical protein
VEKIRWQVDDAIVALEKEVSLLMFLSQVQVVVCGLVCCLEFVDVR